MTAPDAADAANTADTADTVPSDAASSDALPSDALPSDALPSDALPSGTGPGGPDALPTGPVRAPVELRANLVIICALLVGSAVLGVLMGAVWHWLAPKVPLYADTSAVYLKDPEGEQAIGADGTFALIGLGFGLVAGALAYWRTRARQGGVTVAVGLALGGLLGAYIAAKVGTALGPTGDVVAAARAVPTGQTFYGPLKLTAQGVLTAWPIAALAVLMGLTALFTPKPQPQPMHWQGPPRTPSTGGHEAP
ncbi:hypothetical protein [Streptacidiphilus sp. EB129]|uniref:hypothetical protein n=1 Tax=Streptacidiphilus sp. EB129 TaxID=3156262 RepID=UPI00351454B7